MKAHLNKEFNLEHSIHDIIQRLRLSKQKTTNISSFGAHFGRSCITPISNITTKSNNKNLNFNKIIKYYLDEDTIPGRAYLTDAQWADTRIFSGVEIEEVICAANDCSHEEQEELTDGESRLMWPEVISRKIQRSAKGVCRLK